MTLTIHLNDSENQGSLLIPFFLIEFKVSMNWRNLYNFFLFIKLLNFKLKFSTSWSQPNRYCSEYIFMSSSKKFFKSTKSGSFGRFSKYEIIIFTFVSSNLIKPLRNKTDYQVNWFEIRQSNFDYCVKIFKGKMYTKGINYTV